MSESELLPMLLKAILSYGAIPWLGMIAFAYAIARDFGFRGMIIGHLLMVPVVLVLDVERIRSFLAIDPKWADDFDPDLVFWLFFLLRVILVNAILIPISGLGLRQHWRK